MPVKSERLRFSEALDFGDAHFSMAQNPRFHSTVNPLRNDNIFDYSNFKAFADDKIIMTEKLKFGLGRVENIVRKGENAGYQHFLLFEQCFKKLSFPEVLKVRTVWYKINLILH